MLVERFRSVCGLAAAAVLAFGLAGAADADSHAASEPERIEIDAGAPGVEEHVSVTQPADSGAADRVAYDPDRYPLLDVPTKPWAYDTRYFFALTRGLEDEGLSTWGRRASMAGTVPLDVVGLPTAALAGLFGS